jgi:serine/threonine-protein kinase
MVLGTPSYMSPEQARGLDSLDYRCDLWALAVVAYEALTGTLPFDGETVEDVFLAVCTFRLVPVRARRPDLPVQAETFFTQAFAPKIEDRFFSAAELTDALMQLARAEEVEAALGHPLTPSVRRLQASAPNLRTEAMSMEPARGVPNSRELPSIDSMSVALGPNVGRRSAPRGWVLAVGALLALLGLSGVVLIVGARRSNRTTLSQPVEASSSKPLMTADVIPTIDLPNTTEPPPVASVAPYPPSSSKTSASRPVVVATGARSPSGPASVQPPPPEAATTRAPTSSAPRPTPAPAKSVNKDEIF